jgi:hypothetical protein
MTVKNRNASYQFAEQIQVESQGITPVAVMTLPVGTIVESLLARVLTAAVRAGGSVTLTVGDNDTANGYLVAADAKAAAGTVYGEDPTARGAYLYDATKKGSFVKVYILYKTLYLALSIAPDTEGIYDVIITGHRANFN